MVLRGVEFEEDIFLALVAVGVSGADLSAGYALEFALIGSLDLNAAVLVAGVQLGLCHVSHRV